MAHDRTEPLLAKGSGQAPETVSCANLRGRAPSKRADLLGIALRCLCTLAVAAALQSAVGWGQIGMDGTPVAGNLGTKYDSSFQINYTTTATTNSILTVGVSLSNRNGSRGYVSGVTFQVGSQTQNLTCRAATEDSSASACTSASSTYSGRVELWSLANPLVGSGTVTVTLSSTPYRPYAVAGVVSYTGADLTQGSGTGIVAFVVGRGTGTPSITATTTNGGSLVVDVISSLSAVTPGASQYPVWTTSTGGIGSGSEAGNGSDPSVNMTWLGNGSGWWAQAAVVLKPAAAYTLVTLNSFTANPLDGGVQLQWKSGREVGNLGYHVYRDGVRVTSSPVGGSALLAGPETVLTAGGSYSWFDPDGTPFSSYSLEDVDIHGARTMHGPARAMAAAASSRMSSRLAVSRAPVTGQLGRRASPVVQGMAATLSAVKKGDTAVEAALAAAAAVKLRVTAEGWYHVDASQLVAAGMPASVDPRRLQLFAEGIEQAMVVSGTGRVSAIEFYGTGIDSTFTATRVYWLTWNGISGSRAQTSAARGAGAAPGSYTASLTWQPRTLYFPALLNGDRDNYFGPVLDGADPVYQSLPLTHLAGAAGSSSLTVTMQGASDGAHTVIVSLNGADLGTLSLRNQANASAAFTILNSLLKEGENTLRLSTSGVDDVTVVDTVALTYPHSYTADGDYLRFTAQAGAPVTVGGFGGGAIEVVDITDPASPILAQGSVTAQASGYAVSFGAPGAGVRTLLAFTQAMEASPASVVANRPSSWRARQAGGDMVIVSHAAFIDALDPLVKLRQQGRRVAVVDVEDLYDEFSFGEQTPYAIKDFLANANSAWVRKPKWVLLVGDGSYDPKNYLQTEQGDWMPVQLVETSLMETASDDWFADFNNDGVPQMAVGRLPVNTAADAATLVNRIVAYEKAAKPAWKQKALVVAGADDSDNPFSRYAAAAKGLLPRTMTSATVVTSDANAAEKILAAINAGVGLVNYAGHGSQEDWAGGLMSGGAAEALTNGAATPFVVAMTCLNGYFQDVWAPSLAEAFLSAPNGGAVAVWASSGMTNSSPQAALNQAMLKTVYSGANTLGEAAMAAKAAVGDSDVRRSWILLGDPAMSLR